MRKLIVVLGLAIVGLVLAPSALAGCWSCGSDGCCTEAAKGTTGNSRCLDGTQCLIICACCCCQVAGNGCVGTAPSDCDSPFGACEEHQSFQVVPNGEAIELPWLAEPPVLEPAAALPTSGAVACSAV